MLKRVSGAVFEAPAGTEVRVAARSQGNNGVEDARFEYAGVVLDRDPIGGVPAARFTVENARRRFQALVIFDPAAGNNARYDLFEVEPDGGLTDLGESVLKSDSAPLISFVVKGVTVPVMAGPAGAVRAPRPESPVVPLRRRAARAGAAKRAKKTASRKKTATRKTAKKRTAAKKPATRKTTGRTTATARRRSVKSTRGARGARRRG